ncbi:MAG: sn-glycerol-3-phosphate dehydrogenase subunit C [candidate division BRC1 bacterium ADurb.BinA364]|nr:MAG: sn-glycerol-3-phosphate dehydrogenase subunit C [candidate division BRC1 bacterium ADurb.BinA364]
MSEAIRIEPDLQFKRELIERGGQTLRQCYQCGTCTVVCPLSPDRNPFPRKEVLWAQWGLKERLLGDPDIWLCHQCNDCSVNCPREASPGDILALLRQSAIERYAVPGALARWVRDPRMLWILLLIPAALILLMVGATGGFGKIAQSDKVDFNAFFSHWPLVFFFTGFVALSLLGALAGLRRFWSEMRKQAPPESGQLSAGAVQGFAGAIRDILSHGQFKKCEATARRYWGHLLMFYGFLGLLVTTSLAAVFFITGDIVGKELYPFPLWHPVKILGNVSGLAFIAGWILVSLERIRQTNATPLSLYSDWLFLWALFLCVATGFLAQNARFANLALTGYSLYYIHLVLVFFLLVYLPHSKFAHILYRTVAMAYARVSGRENESANTRIRSL